MVPSSELESTDSRKGQGSEGDVARVNDEEVLQESVASWTLGGCQDGNERVDYSLVDRCAFAKGATRWVGIKQDRQRARISVLRSVGISCMINRVTVTGKEKPDFLMQP
jgi:hypothetical protein